MGIINNKICFFKYERLNGELVPSKYKFRLVPVHVPHVIKAMKYLLEKMNK